MEQSNIANPDFTLPQNTFLHGGRYQVEEALWAGRWWITYAVNDLYLERKAAIREFFPRWLLARKTGETQLRWLCTPQEQDEVTLRLKQGCVGMARLNLKGMAAMREVFLENGTVYLAVDFPSGEPLDQILRRGVRPGVEECVQRFLPVLDTLDDMHKNGLLYLGLEPEDILWNDSGAILLDCSASRICDCDAFTNAGIPGLGPFAPVELHTRSGILRGPWTDVYSVCAIMLWCLDHGKAPQNAMERVVQDSVMVPDGLPEWLEASLRKGMEIRPEDRWQSMGELRDALTPPYPDGDRPTKCVYAPPPINAKGFLGKLKGMFR